jgi:hypothetical protein
MCVFVGYRQCGFTFPRVTGVDMRGKAFVIFSAVPVVRPGRVVSRRDPGTWRAMVGQSIDPSALEGM